LLTWIIVFIVFSVLIIIHEAGHLVAAKKAGIAVEVFSLGMGKRLFGIKIGETDYRVSLFPFGGFCKMAGEDPSEAQGKEYEFGAKPVGYRFWVVVAGSLTNYVFAFLLFSIIFMIGAPTLSNEVGQVLNGYPAKKAGIEPGDRIVAINDRKIEHWEDILIAIKEESSGEAPLDIGVERDGRLMEFRVKPAVSEVTNIFGQEISRPMIGIGNREKIVSVSYGPLRAAYYGGERLLQLTAMTYRFLWLLVTGGIDMKTSPASGPIGIAYFIRQAAHMGVVPLLLVTANISMALAIFNLLPFPILDGGHIVFLLIEKLRGKPVSVRVREIIAQVAFVLLIAFALFISWQDAIKFTPLGKMRFFKKIADREALPRGQGDVLKGDTPQSKNIKEK